MIQAVIENVLKNRSLTTLVENQTSYRLNRAELHLFETHQRAERVPLRFGAPILASMLEGKKVMHLEGMQAFDFIPGESVVLPADELMQIDFPEARLDNPTRCLAMAIAPEKIQETVDFLNETRSKTDGQWHLGSYNFHFVHDEAIRQILKRLFFLFTEDHPSKDIFADFMLRELIIRILQTDTRTHYLEKAAELSSGNRLAFTIDFIRKNISENLTVKQLSEKACMSESNFHRVFKNELALTPIEFINRERIGLAAKLLQNPRTKISEVCRRCGFKSQSYFTRVFKQKMQLSPKAYQLQKNKF